MRLSPTSLRKLTIAWIAVAAITAGLLLVLPTVASPQGTLVIRGAESGSTLRLWVKGGRIVVDGRMAARTPPGCRRSSRHRATCSLAGVGSVEIRMGPSGDLVEVLEKLPVPATFYLGGGSDKVIANGERDTCYPGGARRNRCVLGAGNDTCVTGNRNSDCVGGPGRDFCKHGDGSDGCWGGPGADTCVMGPGMDGCHGDGGDDRLYGGASPDQLYGGPGRDFCDGGRGIGKSHVCETGPRH